LPISADAKVLLDYLKNTVIKVGNKVLQIGRKIIEVIITFIKKYPNATIGLIIGLVLSSLISSIPILGLILSPIVNLLLPLLGFTIGLIQDWKKEAERNKIDISSLENYFRPLKNLPVSNL